MMNLKGLLLSSTVLKSEKNLLSKLSLKLAKYSICILLLFLITNQGFSQDNTIRDAEVIDTSYHRHSPTTALILSAIVPGLGQVYNNKVWKVPILYGGVGVSFYLLNYYKARYDVIVSIQKRLDAKEPLQDKYIVYGREVVAQNLELGKNRFRRYRDINAFILGGLYVINLLDALVDAYMFEYDISDDLSFEFRPDYMPTGLDAGTVGVTFCLKF